MKRTGLYPKFQPLLIAALALVAAAVRDAVIRPHREYRYPWW